MRKSLISVLLIVAMVFVVVAMSLPAKASIYCEYARFNPGFYIICYWEIMMMVWDPLDWGDGDADDYGNGNMLVEKVNFLCYYKIDYSYSAIPRAG